MDHTTLINERLFVIDAQLKAIVTEILGEKSDGFSRRVKELFVELESLSQEHKYLKGYLEDFQRKAVEKPAEIVIKEEKEIESIPEDILWVENILDTLNIFYLE